MVCGTKCRITGMDAQREDHSKNAAPKGEHETFRQSLSQQLQAACAERDSDGCFALVVRCPRNHEAGDVGAGNEQKDGDA